MAEKILAFRIKPQWDTSATTEARKLTTELRSQDKAVIEYNRKLKEQSVASKRLHQEERKAAKERVADVDELKKKYDDFFSRNMTGFDKLKKNISAFGKDVGTAFEMGPLRGINQLQRGVETAVGKIFNLKNVILGSALGYGAYRLVRGALHAGIEQVSAEGRARRAVGGDPTALMERANALGLRAGIQGDDALRALIPILEATQATTQKGTLLRGRKLTEEQAARVREQTFGYGANLFQRVATLAPEIETDQLGLLLAQAGTGKEGLKGLVSALGINKAIAARIQKEGEKKKLGQGEILNRILNASGFTEEAAGSARKKFQFQIKSIGAQLEDALGDVGKSAIEKLNKSLGEGTTLAEKLQKFLASDEGKQMIDKIGDSLAKVVGFLADMAKKIPSAIGWISEHKGLLMTIAGIWGGTKVLGGIAGAVSNPLKAVTGGGGTGVAPVFVVGATPGVFGGGGGVMGKLGGAGALVAAAYMTAKNADAYNDDVIDRLIANKVSGTATQHGAMLSSAATTKANRVATLESRGLNHGMSVYYADKLSRMDSIAAFNPAAAMMTSYVDRMGTPASSGGPAVLENRIAVHLDGDKVGEAMERRQIRQARNRAGM